LILVLWSGINYFSPDLLSQYEDRLSDISVDDTANEGRLVTAGLAVVEISQRPLVGWGVDHFGEAGLMFLPQDNDFMPAHTGFLQYWYAAGIVGAGGFLMLFFLPVRRMLKVLKGKPPEDLASVLRLGVTVCLLLFVASNLHPLLFNRFLYMPLFIFAGLVARTPDPGYVRKLVHGRTMRLPGPDLEARV
jgi:O-antigen ligase